MAKRTQQQIGKNNRIRGHQFERDIANALKKIFPKVRRHLEYQKEDAELGIDLVNTEPYGIQCKRGKNYIPINRIEEVKQGVPVLITKGDRKKPVVCMYLDDWIKLLEE